MSSPDSGKVPETSACLSLLLIHGSQKVIMKTREGNVYKNRRNLPGIQSVLASCVIARPERAFIIYDNRSYHFSIFY